VEACLTHIVDDPEKGGHYFTIWAPRQSGKTWLMREVKKEIEACCPEQFQVGMMSMQGVVMKDDEPEENFLERVPLLLLEAFGFEIKNGQQPGRNSSSFSKEPMGHSTNRSFFSSMSLTAFRPTSLTGWFRFFAIST